MAIETDEWTSMAVMDDSLPAEVLIRLKHSYWEPEVSPAIVVSPKWGNRKPRSRPVSGCDTDSLRKDGTATRCSPTTPLSWTSQSTTAERNEASSQQENCLPAVRSKDILTDEAALSINKKSRKRKSFAELKEKENILLNERIRLEKELGTLRSTFMELKAKNEYLKRLKVDYWLQSTKKTAFVQYNQASTSSQPPLPLPAPIRSDKISQPRLFQVQKRDVTADKRHFVLPDLNATPSENDSDSETLYGMS